MPTFKITLAYDGTGFVGWQRQAAGASVQGLLEQALADLAGARVTVAGAGRTDAGVHALGQVASFSLENPIAASVVVRAVNARLPQTVRVLSADVVPESFHARFAARAKAYRYRIWNAAVASPFERQYAWHLSGPLAIGRMQAAADALVGRHDFAALQAAGGSPSSSERTVDVAKIGVDGSLVTFDVVGDGFLRHMVRAMAGCLVEVGRRRREPEWMREVLASRDRGRAGPTAPAHGLFLIRVDYGPI
jgi:tRNA pseudouridine38-40 synthase